MNDAKYIGLDVHQATISVAVMDSAGKLVMEAVLETKAEANLSRKPEVRGGIQCRSEVLAWQVYGLPTNRGLGRRMGSLII